MLKEAIGMAVRVLALCLLVGLVLAFFDIRPLEMFHHLGRTMQGIVDFIDDFFDWALPYIVRGAEVVIPIAVIMVLLRWRGRGRAR